MCWVSSRATAARSASAPRGTVVFGVLIKCFERCTRDAPLSPVPINNHRPGHKIECKLAQKALAAAALAAVGKTEPTQPGALSTTADSAVETTGESASNSAPCDHCAAATPESELLVCTGCFNARYCSLACQHGAWFVHCVGLIIRHILHDWHDLKGGPPKGVQSGPESAGRRQSGPPK